jgi:hypothetical protein
MENQMSDSTLLPKRDFYAIITNSSDNKVLLLEENNHWMLPHWEAQKVTTASALTPWVIGTVREIYGLETVVLKEYFSQRLFENNQFRGTHRVLVLELREGSLSLEKHSWVGLVDLVNSNKTFALSLHAELVQKWLHENSMGQVPHKRADWAKPGWFGKAREWVTSFTNARGWQLTGSIEQRRATIISAQLLIHTTVGNLYLKALPPYCKSEAVFGPVLGKLLPGRVPNILHTEAEQGWILMSDFKGKSLAGIKDLAMWEKALEEYAHLQIDCIPHSEELLKAGVRDRRINTLSQQMEMVLGREDLWGVGEPMGLNQEEISQVHAAIPYLKVMCVKLAAFGLPDTIDSGDFHPDNVVLTSEGFVFYDWSELGITHPFVSLNPFGGFAESFKDRPDYWERLTKAYLKPWQVYLSQPELEQAYGLGYTLGCVAQLVNYAWIQDNIEPEDYQKIDFRFIYYARMLLNELGQQ